MITSIEQDIREIKLKASKMAELAIDMVEKSINGLINGDENLLKQVIEKDREVDEIDNEIDEYAMTVCALKQPEASDLRFVLSALKMNVAIERVADNAVNIAEWGQKTINRPQIVNYDDIINMKNIVVEMLKDALKAFFDKDSSLSKSAIERDDKVDFMEMAILEKLIKLSYSNSANIKSAVRLIFIARALERIGDQATNIAELATFMATGEVVKHKRIKE